MQGNKTSLEIWIDNISLQPFTDKEWSSHQDQSIDKVNINYKKYQICGIR